MDKDLRSLSLVFLLGFLTAFPSISTDLYIPSLPLLQGLWNESMSAVNLTLVAFFSAFCVSILVYGPLSDQFGRKKPLLTGLGIYIAASIFCVFSSDVNHMILSRIFQAIGAASAAGLSVAICKDVYKGSERARILSLVTSVMAFSPMFSPIIGSLIIKFASWHWIFIVQAVLGFAAWTGVFCMRETKSKEKSRKAIETAGAYVQLLKNKNFVFYTILFSIILVPHFAFIASSSNIFIRRFGYSEEVFSLFFAFNAAGIMAGSFISSRLTKKVNIKYIITAALIFLAAGGSGMIFHIFPGPWRVSIPMFFCTLSFGLSRPLAVSLILEQVDKFAGAASSLILFSQFLTAAVAMRLIALEWKDTITALGLFAVITGTGVLIIWIFVGENKVFNPLKSGNESV